MNGKGSSAFLWGCSISLIVATYNFAWVKEKIGFEIILAIAVLIFTFGIWKYNSSKIKARVKQWLIKYCKGWDFIWSIIEVLSQLPTRRTVSKIRLLKFSGTDGQLKKLLKHYMVEEYRDFDNNLIVTTFTNYADLVTALVDHNKIVAKHYSSSSKKYKVFCLTQNTINFVKWFNLKGFRSDGDWIEYLKQMANIGKDPAITLKRFMAFTTPGAVTAAIQDYGIDKKLIPFYEFTQANSSNPSTILKQFIEHFNTKVFITTVNENMTFNDIHKANDPLEELIVVESTDRNEFLNKMQRASLNGVNFPSEIARPLFKITELKLSSVGSKPILFAMKELFNPYRTLSAIYLNNLETFYSSNHSFITEDFFAIGIKGEEDTRPDWKIILAAQMDERADIVRLRFVTQENKISKDPISKETRVTWEDMTYYMDNELLHLDPSYNPSFEQAVL